jgi:hypothetical protein
MEWARHGYVRDNTKWPRRFPDISQKEDENGKKGTIRRVRTHDQERCSAMGQETVCKRL